MASCLLPIPAFSSSVLPDFASSRFESMSADSHLSDWRSSSGPSYPERFGLVEMAQASSTSKTGSECRFPGVTTHLESRSITAGLSLVPCKIEPESNSFMPALPSSGAFAAVCGTQQQFLMPTCTKGDSSLPSKEPVFLTSAVDYRALQTKSSLKRPLTALEADISHSKQLKMGNECIVSSMQSAQDVGAGSPLCSSPSKIPEPDHEVHIWTERERRKKMRSMFVTLHSMLPKVPSKADKSTIVDEAISYIKSLEHKMQRLLKKKAERVKAYGYVASEAADKVKLIADREIFAMQKSSDACFQTLSSSNIVCNLCGADAFITICTSARPNLLSRVFTCVIENHKLEVKNVQITDASDNRRLLMIHVCATDISSTSEGDLKSVIQDLMRCV